MVALFLLGSVSFHPLPTGTFEGRLQRPPFSQKVVITTSGTDVGHGHLWLSGYVVADGDFYMKACNEFQLDATLCSALERASVEIVDVDVGPHGGIVKVSVPILGVLSLQLSPKVVE